MTSNLLLTKLYRPTVPVKHVQRPFLLNRLNEGLQTGRTLTLVSAAAGFGKTTCISAWVNSSEMPVAWLSLDPADDEPGRFFTYLVAALQQVHEDLGKEIEAVLRAGQLPPIESISTTLINDILVFNTPFLLILDDFQVIENRFILQVIEGVITNMPSLLHPVLITREDPSLPLARLRANNQLTEIRAADLRFNHLETNNFLAEVMGLSLDPADMAHLQQRTEGWVVGLQLAGLSLRDRSDPTYFIDKLSGSHRYILSYLTEEVLNQQPVEIQNFLLKTAVLDKLNGDLCNALTGRDDGRLLLEQLYNDNLFLIPLDDEQQWYRYHQLFADLLRGLQKTLHGDETAVLHRRASQWYVDEGLSSEAIQHAIDAADYETAVALIENHALDMLMAWHTKTVKGWMQSIPPEWAAKSPKSNLAFAWIYLFGNNFPHALPYIERLREIFSEVQIDEQDPAVVAEWLALQATLLSAQSMLDESMALANQALAIVPENEDYVRSLIYSGLANNYKQVNDYPRAVEAYQKLIEHGRVGSSFLSEMMGIAGLALYAMERGELRFAFDIASQGVARVAQSGTLPPISGAIYGELGGVYYHWYQLEEAHRELAKSAQVSTLSGYSDAEIYHNVIRSRLAMIENDIEKASQALEKAVNLMKVDAPAAVREELIAQQVRVYLAQNRLSAAEAILAPHGFLFHKKLSVPERTPGQIIHRPQGLLYISALYIILHQAQDSGQRLDLKQGVDLAEILISGALQNQFIPLALELILIRAQMVAILGDQDASSEGFNCRHRIGRTGGIYHAFP